MDAYDIIQRLGGNEAVAAACAVRPSVVVSWGWRGFIPGKRLPAVYRLIDARPDCGITHAQVVSLIERPAPRVPAKQRAVEAA